MSKILKHFGIGGKKNPPQPPKPDYSSLKSASTSSELARSPTGDRPRSTIAGSSPHIGDFEVSTLPSSPHRIGTTERGSNVSSKVKDCCGGSVSPMSMGSMHLVTSTSGLDDPGTPCTVQTELFECPSKATATPPRLLDEYSDPRDLRPQEDMLGACALPNTEDDYSVPYEVKKARDEQERQGNGQPMGGVRRKVRTNFDDPMKGSGPAFPPSHPPMLGEASDSRPREDYDEPWEPWEFPAKPNSVQSMPQHFLAEANPHQTPQLKRTNMSTGVVGGAGANSSETEGESDHLESPVKSQAQLSQRLLPGAPPTTADTPDYENTRIAPPSKGTHDPGSDEEGYTHLREEFSRLNPPITTATKGGPPPPNNGITAPTSAQLGNYEEPWDLSAITKDLEHKIKAAQGPGSAASVNNASPKAGTSGETSPMSNGVDRASTAGHRPPGGQSGGQQPHEIDKRPMEGYEKPWDWKPHQKDDRGSEGYEKPWDLKPHQKDERPTEEYEKPWDGKAEELLAAMGPGSGRKEEKKDDDSRPAEEYDEPWDKKKININAMALGSKEGSPKSSQQSSPKKKALNLDLGWNAVGEKIDPTVPLDQQGWYHGSIGRLDAENLLRVHKEGSYLVRMSESNKRDFSLSLKSATGFMHMKIVANKNGKYILGQFSQPFDSIPYMTNHYSINKLPIRGAEHMSLLHPVINELL